MGRAITVIVAALLLAILVVRNALVEAYLKNDPARAAAAWSGHPDAILASGLIDVGAAAASAQQIDPAIVRRMLAASAKAPLAPEPFLVRGVEAQVAGDAPLAQHSFLEARRRDPRSVASRYFLADYYLKTGQTGRGLSEVSALTRLVPQSLDGVAPQLAAFARMPGSTSQVKMLLRDQPQLEPLVLNELAANPGDVGLALSLWRGQTGEQDRAWQARLLDTLVSTGRYREARSAWRRFDPGGGPTDELIDPRFEIKALPPFGWTLASGPAGVAERERGGRLHILYYGRDDVELASQLLLLNPGPYRLEVRVGGATPPAKSLSWIVRCIPPARDLASIALGTAKRGVAALDFAIPSQGCVAQQLVLAGRAPELPEQVDLSIADLQLSRRAQ